METVPVCRRTPTRRKYAKLSVNVTLDILSTNPVDHVPVQPIRTNVARNKTVEGPKEASVTVTRKVLDVEI